MCLVDCASVEQVGMPPIRLPLHAQSGPKLNGTHTAAILQFHDTDQGMESSLCTVAAIQSSHESHYCSVVHARHDQMPALQQKAHRILMRLLEALTNPPVRTSRAHHLPRSRDSVWYSQAWCVRGAIERHEGFRFSCRFATPSFDATNACHTVFGRARR